MAIHNQRCLSCDLIETITVEPGVNPPCSACGGETERYWMASGVSTFRDDIPGGLVVENYGPHPIRFDSHSERRRYMKAHGLFEKEKFCPMPGTDKDPQGIPNPRGYMDPQTLENARILVSRNGQVSGRTDETTGVLVDLQVGSMTERDAIAISSGDKRRQSRLHRRQHGS